ncbi:hypothetical protein M942_06050 [Enterobacter ludwigii]|nr:hypothetical protein M942_06050 [Enterobacter ludwigii]
MSFFAKNAQILRKNARRLSDVERKMPVSAGRRLPHPDYGGALYQCMSVISVTFVCFPAGFPRIVNLI